MPHFHIDINSHSNAHTLFNLVVFIVIMMSCIMYNNVLDFYKHSTIRDLSKHANYCSFCGRRLNFVKKKVLAKHS